MTRSKRQANVHSKVTETRVLRYLSNTPEAQRDWKERWDIKLVDFHGRTWFGEVKDYGIKKQCPVKVALAALNQVESVAQGLCLAFIHRLHGSLEHDLVAWRMNGVPVVTQASIFKEQVLGFTKEA